jgi:hypothetical protein
MDNDLKNIIEIPINITVKNNKAAIELRKLSTEESFIKMIISAYYHNQPLIIYPTSNNKLKFLGNLMEKGIIYKDGEEYFFNI